MTIRLKVKRLEEQRINKVKDLMEMFRVPSFPTYQYQPMIGASSSTTIDPQNRSALLQKGIELEDLGKSR